MSSQKNRLELRFIGTYENQMFFEHHMQWHRMKPALQRLYGRFGLPDLNQQMGRSKMEWKFLGSGPPFRDMVVLYLPEDSVFDIEAMNQVKPREVDPKNYCFDMEVSAVITPDPYA